MDARVLDGLVFPVENIEEIGDLIMDGQNRRACRSDWNRFMIRSRHRLGLIPRRVVQAFVLPVFELQHHTAARCSRAITDGPYEQGAHTDAHRVSGLIIAMTSAVSPDALPRLPLTWFPLPST